MIRQRQMHSSTPTVGCTRVSFEIEIIRHENDLISLGDIGFYDDDEYFFIVDRIKNIIKVKTFQVSKNIFKIVLNRQL